MGGNGLKFNGLTGQALPHLRDEALVAGLDPSQGSATTPPRRRRRPTRPSGPSGRRRRRWHTARGRPARACLTIRKWIAAVRTACSPACPPPARRATHRAPLGHRRAGGLDQHVLAILAACTCRDSSPEI